MHVLGANYLPKAISHQSRLLSMEEPPSYPPCSFQSHRRRNQIMIGGGHSCQQIRLYYCDLT